MQAAPLRMQAAPLRMQAAPLRMRTALPRMQAAIHCDMSLYLQARNIRKTYGDVVALEDASLDVREGEILALLGPNGAGKTTFIKILATLLLRDSGSINVLGYDMDTDAEAVRHAVGYVGQDTERSAYARLTVRENLVFFGRLRGLADTVIDAQIHKFSGHFDFDANLDKQFVTLSGGQKQTAVIMRALLHEPPLVYLDEPTKGLDPIVARRIRNFLRQLVREDGASLLLTSHMLSEVDELADRVALIHRGSIPIVGAPKRLKRAVGAAEFIEIESDALPDDVRGRDTEPGTRALRAGARPAMGLLCRVRRNDRRRSHYSHLAHAQHHGRLPPAFHHARGRFPALHRRNQRALRSVGNGLPDAPVAMLRRNASTQFPDDQFVLDIRLKSHGDQLGKG